MNESIDIQGYSPRVLNILLVEDSEPDVKISLRAFEHAKMRNNIIVVGNGQECLDYVRHQGCYEDSRKHPIPDLILLDINMPKLNGLEALKSLKTDPALRIIPVIVLTGSNNKDDIRKSYEYGANSYIQKPVTYEEFLVVVDCLNKYWGVINKLPPRRK